IYVGSADQDHVGPAVCDVDVAVLVQVSDVAEGLPSLARGPGRGADVAVGRWLIDAAPHPQFADRTGLEPVSLVVAGFHLADHRSAHRAPVDEPFLSSDDGDGLTLGAAVELPDGFG